MDVTRENEVQGIFSPVKKLWNLITEPPSFIVGTERPRARLISSLLFFFAVTASAVIIGAGYATLSFLTVVLLLVMWAAYGISRTRYYNIAAYIAVLVPNILTFVLIFSSPLELLEPNSLVSIITYIILAVLLLPIRAVIVMMVVNLLIVVFVPPMRSMPFQWLTIVALLPVSALMLAYTNYRDTVERDRQRQLVESLKHTEQANKTLIQANALAKEAVRLKSEFMSTMSHELRTPLNAITGFCGIMLEGMGGEIDQDARYMVERVHSNSERLLTLINQVLDLAKIEADRIELVETPFNPTELATKWQSQLQVLATQKSLNFTVNVAPNMPTTIYGDTERLTQIAMNLLSNAFKFTEAGSVDLRITREGENWKIEVQDTGIGIPPHAQNYIFDEFRQLDGSSTRVYGGTGLGLAITRKLAMVMSGNVRVSSALNEGSTFIVTLPLKTQLETIEAESALKLESEKV